MENNQAQNNNMDNVIDMFFKRDEEETQTNEQQEAGSLEQTVVSEESVVEQPNVVDQPGDEMPASQPAEGTTGGQEEATAETPDVKADASKEEDTPLVLGGNGQFSLFGDDEVVIQDPKKEDKLESCGDDEDDSKKLSSGKKSTSVKSSSKGSSKKTTTTSSTPAPAAKPKKDQNLEVDDTWTIHYATESFRVTDFVNPMPASGKVSLEELRVEMEKEFVRP